MKCTRPPGPLDCHSCHSPNSPKLRRYSTCGCGAPLGSHQPPLVRQSALMRRLGPHAKNKEQGLPVSFEVVHGATHCGKGFYDEHRTRSVNTFLRRHILLKRSAPNGVRAGRNAPKGRACWRLGGITTSAVSPSAAIEHVHWNCKLNFKPENRQFRGLGGFRLGFTYSERRKETTRPQSGDSKPRVGGVKIVKVA